MHGGEVTSEAMSLDGGEVAAALARRRFAPAASQFKCRTTLKRTRPLSPRPPPNVIELPLIPSRVDRRAVRNAQQFAFGF